MFLDYQELVIRYYQQKKAENSLPMRLLHPTPAKLKQECLEACGNRYERKDEKTLMTFFGEKKNAEEYTLAIERCDTDKFRPLNNFLKGAVINADAKNIELLAWLINFEPRPWQFGKTYDKSEKKIEDQPLSGEKDPGETLKTSSAFTNTGSSSPPVVWWRQKKYGFVLILIVALIGVGYLIVANNRQEGPFSSGYEACMYWNIDHYEQISCSKKAGDAQIIALDSTRLINFKRIMNPDTITYAAIGRVWYIKRDGRVEYYTAGGMHPVYSTSALRPITAYIIRTYIFTK